MFKKPIRLVFPEFTRESKSFWQDPLSIRAHYSRESCRWQQRPGIFIPNKFPNVVVLLTAEPNDV